jgi:hypothetical protein
MIENQRRFENPIDQKEMIKGICYMLITFIGGVGISSINGFSWLSVLITIPVSLIVLYILAFEREVVKRPSWVEINEIGVIMNRRLFKKQIIVSWNNIFAVNVGNNVGILWSDKKKYWLLTRTITNEVRETYFRIFNSYPPTY